MHYLRVKSLRTSLAQLLPRARLLLGAGHKQSVRCGHSAPYTRHQTAAMAMAERSIPEGFESVSEGKATVLSQGNSVFYNRAQVVNRDISIAVLRWFIEEGFEKEKKKRSQRTGPKPQVPSEDRIQFSKDGISILEAMSATGLRAIRYAKEIDGIGTIVANDMDKAAVDSIQRNIEFNGVQDTVQAHRDDARVLMIQNPKKFSVVDIDPYGAPTELLDSAVQSVQDGGLLMVTATDMAVLCGNHAEACFTKYGSYSLHKDYHHEQALRILLGCISTHAARHKRVIEPVLCLSIDFYIRVCVLVRTSAQESKLAATKLSYVWQSTGCDSWWLQPVGTHQGGSNAKFAVGKGPVVPPACPISGGRFHMGGPIWNKPIYSPTAIGKILTDLQENSDKYPAHAKLTGMLQCLEEELHGVPLYYTLTGLAKTLKVDTLKKDTLRNALVNAGYCVSGTHCSPNGVKTDAPPEVVWDIMRCWAKEKGKTSKDPDSYQAKILAIEPKLQADFKKAAGVFSKAQAAGKARFVQNPDNWGPRRRHGRPMMDHEVGGEDGKGGKGGDDSQRAQKRARVEAKEEAKVEEKSEAP